MIQPAASTDRSQWTAQRVVLTAVGALLVGAGFWLAFRFYGVAFIQRLVQQLPAQSTLSLSGQAGAGLPLSAVGQALGYVGMASGLGLLGGLFYALGNALIVEGQAAGQAFTAAWQDLHTAWPAGSPLQQFIAQQIAGADEI